MSVATCRACEGDGFVAADNDTPANERVTRDSRRCPYCSGKGYTARRGGARPGAGAKPLAGQPQSEHISIALTEAERAEIEAAVPEGRPVGRWIVEAAVMRARSGR